MFGPTAPTGTNKRSFQAMISLNGDNAPAVREAGKIRGEMSHSRATDLALDMGGDRKRRVHENDGRTNTVIKSVQAKATRATAKANHRLDQSACPEAAKQG